MKQDKKYLFWSLTLAVFAWSVMIILNRLQSSYNVDTDAGFAGIWSWPIAYGVGWGLKFMHELGAEVYPLRRKPLLFLQKLMVVILHIWLIGLPIFYSLCATYEITILVLKYAST